MTFFLETVDYIIPRMIKTEKNIRRMRLLLHLAICSKGKRRYQLKHPSEGTFVTGGVHPILFPGQRDKNEKVRRRYKERTTTASKNVASMGVIIQIISDR